MTHDPLNDPFPAIPPLVARILNAAEDITHRRGHPPDVIRCHPRVAYDLHHAAMTSGLGNPLAPDITIAGMRVDDDPYLPDRVWRLCDEFDTLLYDCREGTPAL